MSTTPKSGRTVACLLEEVDDNLGETTSQDTERSQDGTKCVYPHEVDLSLKIGERRMQKVRMRGGRRKGEVMLRAHHRNCDKAEVLNNVCNGVYDTQTQGRGLEARHLICRQNPCQTSKATLRGW